MLQSLAVEQIKLIAALSLQPTKSPYSTEYMNKFNLRSIGGVQSAINKLVSLDYIEVADGIYKVVDPVFAIWLRHLGE